MSMGVKMTEKDREAFENFFNKHYGFSGEKDTATEAWQAACEFMQDEVEKLKAQNEIMKEALKDITLITRRDGNDNEYEGAEAYISKKALKKVMDAE